MGVELSDSHIAASQKILKNWFPHLNGLESTLSQLKKCAVTEDKVKNALQIIHCLQQHHWVLASTVNSAPSEVLVMDSVYKKLDQETQQTICNVFQFSASRPTIRLIKTQKQKGSKDCGVFAIAFATTIAFGHNPTKQLFRQELMRAHLVHCLNIKQFSVFP